MAYLYVPGWEELSSVSDSPSETVIELSVSLSGKPSRQPPSWRGWKTRPWIALLFGTTLPPSTAARGVDTWILSLPASPANPGASPENDEKRPTSDGFGPMSPASFARLDPDSSTWRTCQGLFTGDWSSFSGTWPRQGSMRSGVCSRRRRSDSLTSATAGSAWPTAKAHDAHTPRTGERYRPNLPEVASSFWPTATVQDAAGSRNETANRTDPDAPYRTGRTLNDAIRLFPLSMWNTPTTSDEKPVGPAEQAWIERALAGEPVPTSHQRLRNQALTFWNTPTADPSRMRSGDRSDEMVLDKQAKALAPKLWPTATASDGKRAISTDERDRSQGASLSATVSRLVLPDQKSSTTGELSRSLTPVLSPRFVEWLMGVPRDWSNPSSSIAPIDFAVWETAWSQQLRLWHSAFWPAGSLGKGEAA